MAGLLQQEEEEEVHVHGMEVLMEPMEPPPQQVPMTQEAVMGEEDFTGMAGAIFSTDNMEVQPLNLEDLRLSTELKVELVGLQLQELVLEAVLLPGTGEAVAGATAVATQAIQA
jgi:hypothetical protein